MASIASASAIANDLCHQPATDNATNGTLTVLSCFMLKPRLHETKDNVLEEKENPSTSQSVMCRKMLFVVIIQAICMEILWSAVAVKSLSNQIC